MQRAGVAVATEGATAAVAVAPTMPSRELMDPPLRPARGSVIRHSGTAAQQVAAVGVAAEGPRAPTRLVGSVAMRATRPRVA